MSAKDPRVELHAPQGDQSDHFHTDPARRRALVDHMYHTLIVTE